MKEEKIISIVLVCACFVGCKSGGDVSETPEVTDSKEQVEAPSEETQKEVTKDAMEVVEATAQESTKWQRTYDYPLISEEYHTVSVSLVSGAKTTYEAFESFKAGAKAVGEVTLAVEKPLTWSGTHIVVTMPRTFMPEKEIETSVTTKDGEEKVKFSPGHPMFVYAYQGEGMCEVAYKSDINTLVFGSATCPDNRGDDVVWRTSEGGSRKLPETAVWWLEVPMSEEGKNAWIKVPQDQLDVSLKEAVRD